MMVRIKSAAKGTTSWGNLNTLPHSVNLADQYIYIYLFICLYSCLPVQADADVTVYMERGFIATDVRYPDEILAWNPLMQSFRG